MRGPDGTEPGPPMKTAISFAGIAVQCSLKLTPFVPVIIFQFCDPQIVDAQGAKPAISSNGIVTAEQALKISLQPCGGGGYIRESDRYLCSLTRTTLDEKFCAREGG
jgi:hypothetical protein